MNIFLGIPPNDVEALTDRYYKVRDHFLIGEAITMRRNLATLTQTFGPQVTQSCVVVLTKEPQSEGRTRNLLQICSDLKVPAVFWENSHVEPDSGVWKSLDPKKLTLQIESLLTKIRAVKKYELTNLQALKNDINAEANRRRDAEATQYETKNYTIQVPYMEAEVRNVTKQRPVVKDKWAGGMGKMLGQKKTYVVMENYTDQETIYHERSREETKTHQVAIPKRPIEFYIDIVKKERVAAFKRQLMQ